MPCAVVMGKNCVAAELNWYMNLTHEDQGLDQIPDLEADQGLVREAGHDLGHIKDQGPGPDQTDIGADPTVDHGQEVDHEADQGQTAGHTGVINKDPDQDLALILEIMLPNDQDQHLVQDRDHDHLLLKGHGPLELHLQKLRSLVQKHDQDHDQLRKKHPPKMKSDHIQDLLMINRCILRKNITLTLDQDQGPSQEVEHP